MTIRRTDSGIQLPKARRAAGGAMRGEEALLCSTGILEYTHADDPTIPPGQTHRVLVDDETLADSQWIDSLKLVPITLSHPDNLDINVNDNREKRVGQVGSAVRFADGRLVADWVVDTSEGMTALRSGARGLSLGYDCEEVAESGTHPVFGEYHAVQRNRRANHLALLLNETPRSATARLRVDSKGGSGMDWTDLMGALGAEGIAFSVAKDADVNEVAKAIAGARRRGDAAKVEAETAGLRANVTDLEAKLKEATDKLSEATEQIAAVRRGDAAVLTAAIADREKVMGLAKIHKVEVKSDIGTSAIKEAIIRRVDAAAPAEMSADFMDAYLAGLGHRQSDRWSEANKATAENVRRGDAAPTKTNGTDVSRFVGWGTARKEGEA